MNKYNVQIGDYSHSVISARTMLEAIETCLKSWDYWNQKYGEPSHMEITATYLGPYHAHKRNT